MRLKIRRQKAAERCPYCHDDLSPGRYNRCTSCQAVYHKDCVTQCVSLGCSGAFEETTIKQTLPLWFWPLIISSCTLVVVGYSVHSRLREFLSFVMILGPLCCVLVALVAAIQYMNKQSLMNTPHRTFSQERETSSGQESTEESSEDQSSLRREPEELDFMARLSGPLGSPSPSTRSKKSAKKAKDSGSKLRQFETMRHRRGRPGLGKTL